MALTSGAKKFIGLIVTIAIVAGGIYGYKQYAAANPPAPVILVEPPMEPPSEQTEADLTAPANPTRAELVNDEPEEPAPTQGSASSNRGLNNVMNAAKNK